LLVPGLPSSLLATVVTIPAWNAYESAVLYVATGFAVRKTPSEAGYTLPLWASKYVGVGVVSVTRFMPNWPVPILLISALAPMAGIVLAPKVIVGPVTVIA